MAKKILIVDDEPTSVYLAKAKLQESGYKIYESRNGLEGLHLANREALDLIITDISMPVMDGIDLYKECKQSPRTSNIPFIVITKNPTIEESFRVLGVNEFLAKPLDPEKILKKVKAVLALPSKRFHDEKLLVIGGNKFVIKDIVKLLEADHFNVQAMEEGTEGISRALTMVPNIVLIDIMLKDLSAKEVIKALQCFMKLRHVKFVLFNDLSLEELDDQKISGHLNQEKDACLALGSVSDLGRINRLTFIDTLKEKLSDMITV